MEPAGLTADFIFVEGLVFFEVGVVVVGVFNLLADAILFFFLTGISSAL